MQLELEYQTRLQLALQQNNVPPVRGLRIINDGPESIVDAIVEVSFDPLVGEQISQALAPLEPGAAIQLSDKELGLALSTERLTQKDLAHRGARRQRVDGGRFATGVAGGLRSAKPPRACTASP